MGYTITYTATSGVLKVVSTSGTKDSVTLTNLVEKISFFTTHGSRMERMISYSYTPGGKEVVNAKDEAEGGAERGFHNNQQTPRYQHLQNWIKRNSCGESRFRVNPDTSR